MRMLSKNSRRQRPVRSAGIPLPFPAPPGLRLAQLSPSPPFESVELFKPERWIELETYCPSVIVGRAIELHRLAEQVELGILNLSSVDHAVLVLTGHGTEPLKDILRVVLWQTFGVPLFELFIGLDESLLAAECEAHEGWHLQAGVQLVSSHGELIMDSPGSSGLRTGLAGEILSEPCPCGRASERLINVTLAERFSRAKNLAAIA